jgi:Na+/melibiose symporter-like transporter
MLVHLVVGAFSIGACFAMLGPARQALVVELVPDSLRGNAMVLANVSSTASRVLGPLLVAVVLAYDRAGPAAAYAVIAALYLISASLLLLLPRSVVRANVGSTHVVDDLIEGLRYVWNHRRLRNLLIFFVCVMLIGFPHVTLIPGLIENVHGRPVKDVTDLYLASAAGALLASLRVAGLADSSRAPLLFEVMAIAFGGSLMLLACAPSFVTTVLCMIIVGATSGAFHALSGAMLARQTEAIYMGRVMSLSLLAFAGFGLTALPLGILADIFGERVVLFGMGIGVLLVSLWMASVLSRAARE